MNNSEKHTPKEPREPENMPPLDPIKELNVVETFVGGMSVKTTAYIHGIHYGQVETAIRKQFRG
jgi:hypothetical protein